ncbi:MAG: acyl-CoA thioesterase [Puniceicoccaceae bacterium]
MDLPAPPLVIERRVPFSQTDASGLIHFTTYFTFMEAAEAELFRLLGIPLLQETDDCTRGFPRVDCQCQFKRPVGFDDLIHIKLYLDEVRENRIHYRFVFTGPNGRTCAEGSMVTAYAMRDASGRLQSANMPEETLSLLKTWKNRTS